MRTTVKTEGFKELEEALKELPKATAKNVLRRALVEAADPMIQDAIAMAPMRPGSGFLKSQIKAANIKFTKADGFKRAFAEARRAGATVEQAVELGKLARGEAPPNTTSAVLIWGATRKAFYGYFLEYGTSKMSARPFMRPAWEKNKGSAIDAIRTALQEEIEKARQRLARKAMKAGK